MNRIQIIKKLDLRIGDVYNYIDCYYKIIKLKSRGIVVSFYDEYYEHELNYTYSEFLLYCNSIYKKHGATLRRSKLKKLL